MRLKVAAVAEASISGQRVFYWDPRRNRLPVLRRWEIGHRVGNFGDLLGPLVIARLLGRPLPRPRLGGRNSSEPRLFSIGSVMHFARDRDVIWGTGVNGKVEQAAHHFNELDVRAVRGPLTREWLQGRRNVDAPAIYGDPALLLPMAAPEARASTKVKRRTVGVVPNFHDVPRYSSHPGFIEPRRPPLQVINDILMSERIAASSLHGVVVAEAFGIPAVLLPAGAENPFKYVDYARGTGRDHLPEASDVDRASYMLRGHWSPLDNWDPQPLLDAFPADLFRKGGRHSGR